MNESEQPTDPTNGATTEGTSSGGGTHNERVLAEALRAHARVGNDVGPESPGSDPPLSEPPAPESSDVPEQPSLPTRWVLLVAVLLGLAAGAVAGLLSLF